MTVELASVKRADMAEQITVVGNLIGAATVEAVPKVAGRLESVSVRLGDRVTARPAARQDRGPGAARAGQAGRRRRSTSRRRRSGSAKPICRFAQTNLDRSRNLFERQLIPKQTYDDTEARYQAAAAQLDLAKAQYAQAQARLDELKINLAQHA